MTVSHRVSVSVTLTVLLRQVSAASPDSRYAGGSHDPPPPVPAHDRESDGDMIYDTTATVTWHRHNALSGLR